MSRTLKPMKVDVFQDYKKRITVEIMLDRNTKTFFAEFNGKKFEAPDAAGVERQVKDAVDSSTPIAWVRVIQLSCDDREETASGWTRYGNRRKNGGHECELKFDFCRKELGEIGAETLERPFPEDLRDDEDRERQARFPTAYAESCRKWEKEQQIPYSEDTWATLNDLVAAVDKARTKLAALFDPKDGGRLLAAMTGAPLLLVAATPRKDGA